MYSTQITSVYSDVSMATLQSSSRLATVTSLSAEITWEEKAEKPFLILFTENIFNL